MSKEQAKHQERVYWIAEKHDDGRISDTGKSVNYGSCTSSWVSVDDLYKNMQGMINSWIQHAKNTMSQHDPLEMVECKTQEEWDSTDDNIDYWEIERMKRILKRPSVQDKWQYIIRNTIREWSDTGKGTEDDCANLIIQALVNQPNE